MVEIYRLSDTIRPSLHIQAKEVLEKMIRSGDLNPGDKLPSEESLAEKMGVSRPTIRNAISYLEANGLVIRKQGIGTFVREAQGKGYFGGLEKLEPFQILTERVGMKSSVIERKISNVKCDPEIAKILEILPDSEIVRVQIVAEIENQPCMYADNYLLFNERQKRELEEYNGSVITYLIENHNPPLTHTRTEIFAIAATEEIASKFKSSTGIPVLKNADTYLTRTGKTIGLGLAYFLTNYYHFYINRRVS